MAPKLWKRHPILLVAGGIFLIFGVSLGISRSLIRAESTDFYPGTCLGTWEKTQHAVGKPAFPDAEGSALNAENSALYGSGGQSIFCGNFLPPGFEPSGDLKNVSLTFIWQMVEADGPGPGEASGSDQPAGTEPAAEPEIPSFTPAPGTQSSGEGPTSFWRGLVSKVFAQSDETDPEPGQESAPSAPAEGSGEPESVSPDPAPPSEEPSTSGDDDAITLPPVYVPLEPIATTSPDASSSTDVDATDPPPSPAEEPSEPDRDFLMVSYSLDGQNWIELAEVGRDNLPNLALTLPVTDWSELKNIQISIEGIDTTLDPVPRVLLDGMLIEARYETSALELGLLEGLEELAPALPPGAPENGPLIFSLPGSLNLIVPESPRGEFAASESPAFNLDLNAVPDLAPPPPDMETATDPPPGSAEENEAVDPEPGPAADPQGPATTSTDANSFPEATTTPPEVEEIPAVVTTTVSFRDPGTWGGLFSFLRPHVTRAQEVAVNEFLPTQVRPVAARIRGPDNEEIELGARVFVSNNNVQIDTDEPPGYFRPGKYRLEVWIFKNNAIYFTESEFTWGVFVVNFNKSIYKTGDQATIGFGVLMDSGDTVCDADIEMTVTTPGGRSMDLSTDDGSINKNATCGPQTVTDTPDYSASIAANETGTYRIRATAKSDSGVRRIEDSFQVEAAPAFDVERVGPTRIYPPSVYTMTFKIKSAADFEGSVRETMPASFDVISAMGAAEVVEGDTRALRWNVSLKTGEEKLVSYVFKAPDISPELYKLGPLVIGGWREARQWQIASDAIGEVILLWEGATAPPGWTCISCAGGAFNGIFPRASSTYAAASSSRDTATHNLTFSSAATASGTSVAVLNDTSILTYPNKATHTHTWGSGVTNNTSSIVPPYRALLMIRAATTTIPKDAIGIFDVAATTSLPSNWTYYSAMSGLYLRASSTVGTGGSATHTHTLSANIVSGASTNQLRDAGSGATVAGASHTHMIAAGIAVGSADNNAPPYVGVVFGKAIATTTLASSSNGLIAFFDDPGLPASWTLVSGSGSPYDGRFLVGSTAFGNTGGSETHNHGGAAVLTSGNGSGSLAVSVGAGTATAVIQNHTHAVTYSVVATSSLPTHRSIMLGKYIAPTPNPVVSNVVLNGGSAITLNENTSTTVSVAATVTDLDGNADINFATGTIYRSGVGSSCAENQNNCYPIASSGCVKSGCSGNSCTMTCSAKIQYFADPTDSGNYGGQTWLGRITAVDNGGLSGSSSTASGVELNSLLALNVTGSINYGVLGQGADTGATNQTTSVVSTGNIALDVELSGTDLISGGNSIAVNNQKYATSTFTYSSCIVCVALSTSAAYEIDLAKPTSTAAVQDDIFWGLAVPGGAANGTYSGTNTFTAIADTSSGFTGASNIASGEGLGISILRQILRSSEGALYAVTFDPALTVADPRVRVWKSSDDGSTWTEQDTGNRSEIDAIYGSVSAAIDASDVIHIVYYFTHAIEYRTFNTNTDTYGSIEFAIDETSDGICGPATECFAADVSLNSSGVPHVAALEIDDGTGDRRVYYANRIGGSWNTPVLIDSLVLEGTMQPASITVNEDNIPEVAYIEPENEDLVAAVGNAANATSFTTQVVDASVPASLIRNASIAVDTSGNTWIGYVDENGLSDYVTLVKHNDADAWNTWQTPVNDSNAGTFASVAINGSDVYIFFSDENGDVAYNRYNGSSWLGKTVTNSANLTPVAAKWSFNFNNFGSTAIDYLFSDGTDIFYDRLAL